MKVTMLPVVRLWGVLRGIVSISPTLRINLVAPSLADELYSPDLPLAFGRVPLGVPPIS
jgi:hypothetical protein